MVFESKQVISKQLVDRVGSLTTTPSTVCNEHLPASASVLQFYSLLETMRVSSGEELAN